MSDPRKELEELQATFLNIATDIGNNLKMLLQLQGILETLYKQNQEKKLQNELGVMEGQPGATPNLSTKASLEAMNQEIIERNKQITVNELKLKQLQDTGISSPTDADQAEILKRSLTDLSNQNAQMLKIQKELQKQAFLSGEIPQGTDIEIAKKGLDVLQEKTDSIYTQNKTLKAQIQAQQAQQKLPAQDQDIKKAQGSAPESIVPKR